MSYTCTIADIVRVGELPAAVFQTELRSEDSSGALQMFRIYFTIQIISRDCVLAASFYSLAKIWALLSFLFEVEVRHRLSYRVVKMEKPSLNRGGLRYHLPATVCSKAKI